MRIAVIGGTGVVGRHTVEALRKAGHEVIVVARARGADVLTGAGLDDALVGVDAVIDVSNMQGPDAQATQNLFAAATRNLLGAEQRAQVRHHVLAVHRRRRPLGGQRALCRQAHAGGDPLRRADSLTPFSLKIPLDTVPWVPGDPHNLPRLQLRPLIESGEQPAPGRRIQESGDREAVAALVRPHCRLGFGRKDTRDRPRVKPKRAQMLLRDLDVARGEQLVRRRLQTRAPLGLRRHTPRQERHRKPHEDDHDQSQSRRYH